jgi:hypothetical protein
MKGVAGVVLGGLVLAGCAPNSPISGHATPTQLATPAAPHSPFPVAADISCPNLTALGLSRILLAPADYNQRRVVLCEAADPTHPRELKPLEDPGVTNVQFLSEDIIGLTIIGNASGTAEPGDETTTLKTLSLKTGSMLGLSGQIAVTPGVAWAAGWSHDGTMAAYVTDTQGGPGSSGPVHHFWFHAGAGSATELVVPPATAGGRDGIEGDETLVAFSPDDRYVALVDTAVYRLQIFKTSDQSIVYTAPSGGVGGLRTQGAWMQRSDRFYFRNNTGVYFWDPASGISTYAPNLHWQTPSFSPDDHWLAFTVWDASGVPRVEADGLGTGIGAVQGPPNRVTIGFATSSLLLENETQPCQGMCQLPFSVAGPVLAWQVGKSTSEQPVTPAGWRPVGYWPASQ